MLLDDHRSVLAEVNNGAPIRGIGPLLPNMAPNDTEAPIQSNRAENVLAKQLGNHFEPVLMIAF